MRTNAESRANSATPPTRAISARPAAFDSLNGYSDATMYPDGTVVRVSVQRTEDEAYPSGWRYTFHYGALTAGPETVDDETEPYREGLNAIRQLKGGEPVEQPAVVRFLNESQLTDVFNERTYTLLGVIRDERPDSIRETARLVGRDKKNVYEELTTLEALGVIRFEDEEHAKRPVFPYDDLVVTPLADRSGDGSRALP